MVDFRRLIYAFTLVVLLAGLTVPVSAQQACFGNANNPLLRGEDFTALAGDIFVTCTGGIPTAAGNQVPKVNITVFTSSTTITSKITDASVTPAFNEALLIVDEAGSASFDGSASPILNCGNASAPYGTTPYVCDITGTGSGAGVYDGTFGRPNVFQGRQIPTSAGAAIQFIGVPLDPAGTDISGLPNSRRFRITNLRYNAAALGIYGGGPFTRAFITTNVNFNATNFGGSQNFSVVNGTVRPGFLASNSTNASPANFLQCTASNGNAENNIVLREGFSTVFKARNWRQIQDNGTFGFDWTYNTGATTWTQADVNQNVPNTFLWFYAESGLMFPPGLANPSPDNPPSGTGGSGTSPIGTPFSDGAGVGGIDKAGTVTQGTRVAVRFSSVPNRSNPSVPNFVLLKSGTTTTGVMALVLGTDANGAGGLPTQVSGTTAISDLPGGVAVYEVLFSNPNEFETATITVTVAPGASPKIAALTATASFAPFYAASTGSNLAEEMTSTFSRHGTGFPVPRFLDIVQGPFTVYDYSKCPKN